MQHSGMRSQHWLERAVVQPMQCRAGHLMHPTRLTACASVVSALTLSPQPSASSRAHVRHPPSTRELRVTAIVPIEAPRGMPGTAVLPQSSPPHANMDAPMSPQTSGAGDESARAPWQQLVADAEEQAAEDMERAGAAIKWSDEVEYEEEDQSVAAAADELEPTQADGASQPAAWTDEGDEHAESPNADGGDGDAEGDNENERAYSDEHLDAPLTTADLQATPAAPSSMRGASGRTESPQPPRSQVNDALAFEYSSATAALTARTAALAAQLAASQRALQEIEQRNAPDQSWPQRADSASPGRPPATATMTPLSTRSASSASPARSALSIAALPVAALAAHHFTAAVSPLSSPLYSPHTQPRTAHVFLPPPPGVQPSSSPHAAALPSGLQLAAAAAKAMAATMSTPAIAVAASPTPAASVLHSPHPHASPLSASSGMSSSSAAAAAWPSSFDPTAYAAASAHVYGDWRPAASPSPSPLPSAPVHPAADMRFFRATHLARAGGIPTHTSSGSDGLAQAASASASAGGLNFHDSFQRHLGLTLARQRAEDNARSEQAAHAPQPHSQPAPAVEVENTLQAQLRSLAASPDLQPRGHGRPSPSPSPSPVRLASSFSAAATAAASPRFSLSQLHASPAHAYAPSASPLQSPSSLSLSLPLAPLPLSSPSPSPHYSTSVVGGALQSTLNTLTSNLHAFQSSMLSKQQQAERARAAALDRLEEGASAFDQSLQLEVRNCKLASTSMQKVRTQLCMACDAMRWQSAAANSIRSSLLRHSLTL